ncbi:hypothetical protein C8K61_11365 [Pseudomonas sp. GV071]|nr:hypothetical protein C8K61_11365 [Pseudomonas sp. GV071]
MLNLQLYERRLKRVLPHFEFSSDGPTIEEQTEKFSKMTLGGLVGQLVDKAYEHEAKQERPLTPATTMRFTTRFSVGADASEVEQIKNDLTDLVAKRNLLIHHFRDHYKLQSEDDCLAAKTFLDSLNAEAKRSVLHIEAIADRIDKSRRRLAEYFASAEGQELFNQVMEALEKPDCANGENLSADSR